MAMRNDETKKVVVFIMGATGSGKSKLSVSLATHIGGEIINSDKIQVYKGLDVVSNKIPELEKQGVPHHLLGEIDPDEEYTARDFCSQAISAIEQITNSGKVPIIVGGSNSFIEALVEDPLFEFKSNYLGCFIWLIVSPEVLSTFVSKRVDQMVVEGLVDEVRGIFAPDKDYTKGIRKAIGVPEMDKYLRAESNKDMSDAEKKVLLETAIGEIKANTIKLIYRQVEKIRRLRDELGWSLHRIDSTDVFEIDDDKKAQEAIWMNLVFKPSINIVDQYFKNM